MIKRCNPDHLFQCVEIAYLRNSIPENNCAFCPASKELIMKDLEFLLNDPNSLLVGYFDHDLLIGFCGCFVNPQNNWGDFVGPFFKGEWDHSIAVALLPSVKDALPNVKRFNFYFNTKNQDYHNLMCDVYAVRQDNEYIHKMDRKDYIHRSIKASVVSYNPEYSNSLIHLHEKAFPDVYITGQDIIDSVGKTREVFCVLDENGDFAGYGILKLAKNNEHLTAEVFAVDEKHRGKGYGWALLNTVVNSAFNKHNRKAVYLVVDKLNTHAMNLYYSCGFKLVTENAAYCLRT